MFACRILSMSLSCQYCVNMSLPNHMLWAHDGREAVVMLEDRYTSAYPRPRNRIQFKPPALDTNAVCKYVYVIKIFIIQVYLLYVTVYLCLYVYVHVYMGM